MVHECLCAFARIDESNENIDADIEWVLRVATHYQWDCF